MGRTAKHRTSREKAQARKASKQRYAGTDKGKAAIAEQNAKAYQHRVAARSNGSAIQPSSSAVSTNRTDSTDIPHHLLSLSRQPVPSTSLFRHALHSADNLDESELGVWNSRPPYHTLPAHQENAGELRFTDRIVEVMNGKRLRELKCDDEERVGKVQAGRLKEVVREVEGKIKTLLLTCQQDASLIAPELPGSKRDKRMAGLHLEWAAKQLCMLHAELTALQTSADYFLEMYSEGKLGWRSVAVQGIVP